MNLSMPFRPVNERLRLASIEITQRCNNHCFYCEQAKAERDMPVERFAALLDELAARGIQAVALGGGEPTLHPELVALLEIAHRRGVQVGLTTNARNPGQVLALLEDGLLDSLGVSAGKGDWLALAAHPHATVNLLLLRGGQAELVRQAVEAIRQGVHCLLLLGYKGHRPELGPSTHELSDAFSLLTVLGRQTRVVVAADDYTRRRLGLAHSCGEGFVRVSLDGNSDRCCFPHCEYRGE
ncbi:MAG: radical SAM protein [Thermoflexales bacterium]|nr:radical SAM protein [Thermoflexales bacterium]